MWVIHSRPWYWLVWPWWGGRMYQIVTGVTLDVGVPSTYLVFIMEILIPGKTVFILKWGPGDIMTHGISSHGIDLLEYSSFSTKRSMISWKLSVPLSIISPSAVKLVGTPAFCFACLSICVCPVILEHNFSWKLHGYQAFCRLNYTNRCMK